MTFQKIEQNMNYYRKNKLQTTFTPCQLVKSKQLDTKQTKKTIKKQNSQAIARTKNMKENQQTTKNKKFLWNAKTKNFLRPLDEPNISNKINKIQKTEIFYGLRIPKTI